MNYKEHTRLDLVAGGNVFKQGDHMTLGFTPRDYEGDVVDLTGKAIEGVIYSRRKGIMFTAPADYVTAEQKIEFTIDEVLDHGEFQIEFTVTDAADPEYRRKFPSAEQDGRLIIKPSADNMDVVGVQTTTVSQLKNELQGLQSDFESSIIPQVDELKQRVDDGVGAFTEDTEVLDARMGEPNLRAFNEKLTTQLDEKAEKIEIKNTVKGVPNLKKKRAIVSFIDDDGHGDVWTRMKPIFDRQGVPACAAVISANFGVSGLTTNQIIELNNSGWEILSHTHNHLGFNSLSNAQIEEQCRLSKQAIESLGIPCNSIVYPGGQKGDISARPVVSKYFRSGLTTNNYMATNKIPFYSYSLTRVGMGTMTDTVSTEFPDTSTFEYYKACVDKAIAEGSWLVFMMHINATPDSQLPVIEQTIEYIKSLNVEILTVNDALNEMGNSLEIGNYEDPNSDYLVVGGNGKVYSKELGGIKVASRNSLTLNTPISEIDNNKITIGTVDGTNATGTPTNTGGTIEVEKIDSLGYFRKTFKQVNNFETFEQTVKSDGTTTPWIRNLKGGKQIRVYIAHGTNLSPQTTRDREGDVEGVKLGDVVMATPRTALPPNVMYNAFVSAPGKVTIRLSNPTAVNITDTLNYEWMITYIS